LVDRLLHQAKTEHIGVKRHVRRGLTRHRGHVVQAAKLHRTFLTRYCSYILYGSRSAGMTCRRVHWWAVPTPFLLFCQAVVDPAQELEHALLLAGREHG